MKGEAAAITASAPETFMVLKKNQALNGKIEVKGGEDTREAFKNSQVFNNPLHDAKVVHHLHKGDEEYDSAQDTSEEPGFVYHGILVEEEDGTDLRFLQEVRCEESDPLEDLKSGIGLEYEEGDGLLEEKADNDRSPKKHDHQDDIVRKGWRSRTCVPTMGPVSGCGRSTKS